MARKREVVSAPIVTSLPLPSSDSVLVIDLPDGQKLLVGKMSSGSVIEVATWRGTGRPDSRTNRLMLGMSSSESETQLGAPDSQDDMVVDKRSVKYWLWLVLQIFRKIKELSRVAGAQVKALLTKKKNSENFSKPADKIEDDVQAWLDNIMPNKSKYTSALAASTKAAPVTKRSSTVRKPIKKSTKKSNPRSKA